MGVNLLKKQNLIFKENVFITFDALKQHVHSVQCPDFDLESSYKSESKIPDPWNFGWQDDVGEWKPLWLTQPIASKACLESVQYQCLRGCKGRCSYLERNLKRTDLCACSGNC